MKILLKAQMLEKIQETAKRISDQARIMSVSLQVDEQTSEVRVDQLEIRIPTDRKFFVDEGKDGEWTLQEKK